MFPFFFPRAKTAEELQREKLAQDVKDLEDYLSRMTPEARARFWADIEGKGDDREKQPPPGN